LSEGCEPCFAELQQFNELIGVLGSATAPDSPPVYLRDLLAVRIEKERTHAPTSSGTVIAFSEKVGRRKSDPESTTFSRVLPWAVAATLLIALAYTFVTLRSEGHTMRAALDQEREQNTRTVAENIRLKEQLTRETSELSEVNSVLSAPQWRMISLTGQSPAPDSAAKVYWDVQGKRWVVTANLPPPPEGKVYQLWFVTASEKISAGLINPDRSGHGFAVVQFPSNISGLQAAAITLEPAGGSAQPTMPIYALGKIS
jgi:anti-sigma-K factor RskA